MRQNLDSNIPTELRIVRPVDLTRLPRASLQSGTDLRSRLESACLHASRGACPQGGENFVRAEPRAGEDRHGGRCGLYGRWVAGGYLGQSWMTAICRSTVPSRIQQHGATPGRSRRIRVVLRLLFPSDQRAGPSTKMSPTKSACPSRRVVYRNSARFNISSAVRTSAISIAPPMMSPMIASGGANKMPAWGTPAAWSRR